MNKLYLLLIAISLSFLSFAQVVDSKAIEQEVARIKGDKSYLWGEGRGTSLRKADNTALDDLISQISTTVESDATLWEESEDDNFKQTFQSTIKTYSKATLNNTQRIVNEKDGEYLSFRYMKRDEITKVFESRKNKIIQFAKDADASGKKGQISDALRYYYWSFVLLQSHPESQNISVEINGESRLLKTWIPLEINTIFSNVKINISELTQETNHQTATLSITYKDVPVCNFDYSYWNGQDWSNLICAKDGKGVIDYLPADATADNIRIKGEYVFENQAVIDAELKEVLEQVDVIPIRNSMMLAGTSGLSTDKKKTEIIHKGSEQQITEGISEAPEKASTMINVSFFKPIENSDDYLKIMKEIEKSIVQKQYESAKMYFTESGYTMFTQLINYGQAKIVGTPDYKFIEYEDGTICRSLPLSFSFKNNHQTFLEDVVFDFDSDKKIRSLSFGLSQVTMNDIISNEKWDYQVRMTLVRFLENYKTAYALKRVDYIESIFSQDALIITGSVVKKYDLPDQQTIPVQSNLVKYTVQSKEQYIKRLRTTFSGNEFINLRFTNCEVRTSRGGGKCYGIQIQQDYYSSNYGDTGYLFLLVDLNDPEKPIIHVRAWQPEKDPETGLIDIRDFTL
ncbi:MAG: LPP20 family lipoprotein [Bacteroidales bacterium]|nr:LPP20 family lipoprotein [Bacteroidales bacterium]